MREQTRFDGWIHSLLGRRERKARKALTRIGGDAAIWARGSKFAWFALTDEGIQNVAYWAQASADSPTEPSDETTIPGEMAREFRANSEMFKEMHVHRADRAEARLRRQRARHKAEMKAKRPVEGESFDSGAPKEPSETARPVWHWEKQNEVERFGKSVRIPEEDEAQHPVHSSVT